MVDVRGDEAEPEAVELQERKPAGQWYSPRREATAGDAGTGGRPRRQSAEGYCASVIMMASSSSVSLGSSIDPAGTSFFCSM